MMGHNLFGMLDYSEHRRRMRPPAASAAPAAGPASTAGTVSPMMRAYVDRRGQSLLSPPPAPAQQGNPFTPYRPAATAPIPGFGAPPAPRPAPAGPYPQAGQAGSTLQDPGFLTDAGKAYSARVTANLSGQNPLVQTAQATEDTAAARRAYSARKGATETLAQTPFAAGSAQYTRALNEAQAGVDVANQAGQAGVNQLARQAGRDTLAAANGLEDQQYARAVGERTNRQAQQQQLLGSIQDPKAKYAFQRALASGMDPESAYRAIVGETGTINPEYRGQSPVQNVQQDATDWIKATRPDLVPGSPEFSAAVTGRMQEIDKGQRQPVTDTNNAAALKGITDKARAGQALKPEDLQAAIDGGVMKPYTAENIPTGKDDAKDLIGQTISLDGKQVKVKDADRYTSDAGGGGRTAHHTDYTAIEYNGKTYYVDSKGFWYDHQPSLQKPGYKAISNPLKGA